MCMKYFPHPRCVKKFYYAAGMKSAADLKKPSVEIFHFLQTSLNRTKHIHPTF